GSAAGSCLVLAVLTSDGALLHHCPVTTGRSRPLTPYFPGPSSLPSRPSPLFTFDVAERRSLATPIRPQHQPQPLDDFFHPPSPRSRHTIDFIISRISHPFFY